MAWLVNIIGAGNLGKTIGHLLVKHELVQIGSVCNQSKTSTMNAIQFIGQGTYCSSISELQPADITFITTPDEEITVACEALSKNSLIKKGSVILHCSGALTSDALASVKEKGCYTVSVHPMRSFTKPEVSIQEYPGTYCAIEGDANAIPNIRFLFNAIGSITYEIDKTKKPLYHAAGVFASNYLVALADQALSCLKEAGVENKLAMGVITNIMKGTVSNLEKTLSPAQSLTGPIQRGDIATVLKHIHALSDMEKKYLYSALGKATLHLTNHDEEKKKKWNLLLYKSCIFIGH
jgi:predicted short-subunit dehydrogenase-like oxidoreductase (DUF2520 family)